MDKVSTGFLQPKRRLTRQRSGFNVSGVKTGSECTITKTKIFKTKSNKLQFDYDSKDVIFTKLFERDLGMFGAGGYLKSNSPVRIKLTIYLKGEEENKSAIKLFNLSPGHWSKIGTELQLEKININKKYNVSVQLLIEGEENFEIEIYDLYAGVVKFFAEKPDYYKYYHEKTELYKPDIYYLSSSEFIFDKESVEPISTGIIICKSCNRCARFLPIDVNDQINALGYSNHCKKKAPCIHNAFSRYLIENPEDIDSLPNEIKSMLSVISGKKYLSVHFGFQLECRSCKKFEVNAPLNPLRNKAQHHEDGARRRAFERLIIDLTKKDVVKNFRSSNGLEFQDYVWKNFSKKCFACGKKLNNISDMHIDHTLPLVYFWPLDKSATALCSTCNSIKHDLFPSEFKPYTKDKLLELSRLTGIPLKILSNKERVVNEVVVNLLVENVEWLFDDFLARKDYQKIKKGKKVADLIYKAINKVLTTIDTDLVAIYKEKTGKLPTSITLGS